MAPWPIYLIAITSTVGCFILWFRDVRRIMRERKSTVESAASQLAVWEEKARKAQGILMPQPFWSGVKTSIVRRWISTTGHCGSRGITCLHT